MSTPSHAPKHLLVIWLLWLMGGGLAYGATPAGMSEYFVPVDEDNEHFILNALGGINAGESMHSLISVTPWASNTAIYYDHWEDGYEFDIDAPTTADETCSANIGQITNFESVVPRPRTPANVCTGQTHPSNCSLGAGGNTDFCYDGRDRIYVVGGGSTVVRAGWPQTTGVVTGVAEEVYPVTPQLTTYILPFGEEIYAANTARTDYRRVFVIVQATEDATVIEVDFDPANGNGFDALDCDHDGTTDGSQCSLDAGETYRLDQTSDGTGGPFATLNSGTVIQGSGTLQVQYINGDSAATYNSRATSAFPRGFWDDEYYAPVDGAGTAGDVDILLHNPNATPITVDWETRSGSGTFSIGAYQSVFFQEETGAYVPDGSAVYLRGSDVFWGVSDVDTNRSTWDWAYSLVPAFLLDDEQYLSWSPGCFATTGGLSCAGTAGDRDNGGVFITPAQDNTTIFVDRDNDGVAEDTYGLDRLEVQYVTDGTDGDMTGAHVWATGPYVLSYGENPQTAPTASPGLDAGYTTLPNPGNWIDLALTVAKTTNPVVLSTTANPATTTYTLRVQSHEFTVDNLSVVDTMAADWNYLIGTDTTTITLPNGSTLSTDPAKTGATCGSEGGTCTLTWSGLGNMAPNQTITIVFTARTVGTPSYASGTLSRNDVDAIATRTVGGVTQTFTASDFAFNAYSDSSAGLAITKDSSVPEPTPVSPGDTLTYTVALTNTGASALTNVSLYDQLPNGVAYSPGSASVVSGNCLQPVNVADNFDTVSYTNNDGSLSWADAWTEVDSGPTPAESAGFVRVSGGALQFRAPYVADNFITAAYTNNVGSINWAGNWTETGDDGTATNNGDQNIYVTNGRLRFDRSNVAAAMGFSASRTASLNGATSATVSFVPYDSGIGAGEVLRAQYSLNGGASWTTIGDYNGGTAGWSGVTQSLTLTGLSAPTITLRFGATGTWNDNGDHAELDDVRIALNNAPGTQVQRTVDLTGASSPALSFTTAQTNLDAGGTPDTIVVEASTSQAGPFTTLATATGGGAFTPAGPYSLTPYISGTTTIRNRVTAGFDAFDETRNLDDVNISYSITAAPTLSDPPILLSAAQGCTLPVGGSLTLSYQVTVDDPLATGIEELLNVASASCAEIPIPISDDARNIVNNPSSQSASVGDRVWIDSDGDGAVDVGEAGIPNVQITLKDQFGTPLQTTMTDSQGRYQFTGVPPGSGYYVQVVSGLPAGLTQTNGTNDRTSAFDLAAGQSYQDADLGYRPAAGTAIIGDRVWSDADGDGVQDPGEPGLPGVTVLLYTDTDGNGVIDTGEPSVSTTTGPDGSYLFSVTATGTEDYIVFVDPAQTALSAFSLTTQEYFFFQDVADGGSYRTADVGVVQSSSGTTCGIKDRVWLDSNSDGDQDPGEPGIPGVTVDLLDASGNVIGTATTDANGDFSFTGVPEGVRYGWRITDQNAVLTNYFGTTGSALAGQFQMSDTLDEADDQADGVNDDVVNYSDPAGPVGYRPNFGYNLSRSIGDTVFNDLNGNGIQEPGEPGISGVVVRLYNDADGDGVIDGGVDTVRASLTTDANGNYLFSGLSNGNYIVSIESPPSGYGYTGTGAMADSDPVTAGQQNAASVVAGVSDLTNDFPYQANSPRTLSGRLWNDANRDGDDEAGAETGFANVTIELYQDTNGNGVIDTGEPRIGTTRSASDGSYSFAGIQGTGSEDYMVRVTDDDGVLSGYTATYEKTGGTAGPFDGLESIVNLNGDVTDLDFGYYQAPIPLPITLASLDSRLSPDGLTVEWTTATETRNAGFHLYGRLRGETDWQRLTETLVPSKVIDSLEPQRYSANLRGIAADELLLEDWDTLGQTNRHGPFAVGRLHGFDALANSKRIDWKAIRAENRVSKARRTNALLAAGVTSSQGLAASAMTTPGAALLWVTEAGVQRVSFDALQTAGADFGGVAVDDLALTDRGVARPRHVIDANANGAFDSGDSVEFVGTTTPTLYSGRNAYRLQVDPSRALVVAANSRSIDPAGAVPAVFGDSVVLERERGYSYTAPTNDPWYDQWLFSYGTPARLTRGFDLPGYAGGDVTLHLSIWGVTDWSGATQDHHLVVKVNGTQVEDARFDGSTDASRSVLIPAGTLNVTGNTLTLEAPGDTGYDYDIQAFDGFSVEYDRRTEAHLGRWQGTIPDGTTAKIQVTGFEGESVAWRGVQRRVGDSVLSIQGKGSWLAADARGIRQPQVQAEIPVPAATPTRGEVDYLIIAHPQFIGTQAIADLVALQQGRGYRTAVIDVDTLYAAYSDFEVSPDAIRSYLREARAPYVLLVGGDSYDYRDYLGLASQSFVPTHYVKTGTLVTYTPADTRHVDYNGDSLPQARIGRLPARTEAELAQVVAKLTSYAPPTVALFAAGPSDSPREFAQVSEGYAGQLLPDMPYSESYVDDLGLTNAKVTLTAELNLGGAVVSYIGHSSYRIWGLNPSHGILFWADDARASTNDGPHLVTQWGCWNTYFVDPRQDTMANGFLLQAHGAAAVLGATALTDLNMLRDFGEAFFAQVGRRATLGDTLLRAQQAYAGAHPGAAADLRGFVLLGDPAAELRQ
jgi:uncharacterized repeat protein (TIGR01451 family)